jgi:all-trans-retinol 13,14-reductase
MQAAYDAIVIGSGIGGLTSAALLARNGLRPLVLEAHFFPGGNTQTFRRKKLFDFDVGLHYVGDCGPDGTIPTVLRQIGIADEIEWLPMDPDGFDTLILPDLRFRVPVGWDRYRERLHQAFPGETRAIDRYLEVMQQLSAGPMGPPPEQQAQLQRLMGKPWDECTLGEVFDSLECSLRLRHVLAAQSGTYAAPPSRASAAAHALLTNHYLRGAYFPRGGGRSLVDALVRFIEAHGGEIRLRSRVQRILLEGGRAVGVELAKGGELRAPIVISNADAKRTYLEMVGERHLSPELTQRVRESRMALPLFITYVAMKVDPAELGLANSNYGLMEYTLEEDYQACYEGRIPEKPAVFISLASLKDPTSRNIAPEGYTNLQLITVAPAQPEAWGVEKSPGDGGRYRHTLDYTTVKKDLEERMLRHVEEKMPGLIRNVEWLESATPLTQERFTLSTGGTSYGLEHSPDQYRDKRFAMQTEIPGLYLVGANTVFGHGIAGTMVGGAAAAGAVLAAR